jgi:hypothetical protein
MDQVLQHSLGAALIVVVDRGQLLRLKARVEAELLPHLGMKRPFLVVTRLEARQDPALALGMGEADDDALMKTYSGARLLETSTTILLTIIIADQENTLHRRPPGFDQCECPSSLLGIEIGGLAADEPTRADSRLLREIPHVTPG